MAVPGRKFVINLIGDSSSAEKAFGKVGQAAGRLKTPVALAAAAITASFVAVVAVVGKVTKELLDLGEVFNDSFRTIRVGTGATGAAFAELQDSFRNVAKSVPNDMGDIATAIAEVNTRTGATGSELETLAKQFLTVSRLLGGDVQSNVRAVTRLFGDFGVETEDQADVMNVLFRASQMTGAGFDTLANQTVQYGASLRNLGFTLPESIALLASFEKNGTNLETVMSGLRTAQAKLAESGKPLSEALADVIRDIQNAETAAEGTTLAMEIFGRRSGPDLYDAIQSGRLGVDELVGAIVNGSDTIDAAADDTDGFREAWENFKNYLKITLEPAATEVFGALEGLVNRLKPAAEEVMKAYEEDGLQGALEQIAIEWDKIYDQYLEPLWLRFLDFLEFTVIPAALEIGGKIGQALGESLRNAFGAAIEGMAQRFLDNPATWLLPSSRLLVAGLRGFGRDLQGEIDLGLPGERRVPIEPPMNPKIPNLPDYPWMQPDLGVGGVVATPGRRAGIGSFVPFAEGGLVLSPTLGLVGEAGPELVVPLDRAPQLGGTTVNVTVTSADPEAVVDAIRRYTRANGPLAQVVRV